ncbi:hypothetical protein ACIRPN_12315 [Streptomyces sp. NPDC101230]
MDFLPGNVLAAGGPITGAIERAVGHFTAAEGEDRLELAEERVGSARRAR